MMSRMENTIVTACDARYLWGALLLALSMRKAGSRLPIHVLHGDLQQSQIEMLEQLPDLRCLPAKSPYAMFQKPEALLSADTSWVTWMDCDVLWSGDLTPLLVGDSPGIQVRVRGSEENADAFSPFSTMVSGAIPSHVLDRWRNDVGERSRPRFDCMAVSNAIALHRDYRWLPVRWHELMQRVSERPNKLVDRANTGYRITDEAALTALLLFCREEVPVLPYRLDQDPDNLLIHFAGTPKPWAGWQLRYMKHYETASEVVRWAVGCGFLLPPIPDALRPERQSHYFRHARLDALKLSIRQRVVSGLRRLRVRS
jgi:hypothetical protein